MDRPVRTALFGYGHLGKYHAQKCADIDNCDFVAIVETNKKARQAAQTSYPSVQVVDRPEQIMGQVEALIIAVPTSAHYPLVKQGLEMEKHIFCEKPLCQYFSEGEELAQLAQKSQKVLQVGHSERFHQAWKLIEHSPIVREEGGMIRIERVAPFKGRGTDVDVVRDLMSHDLDLLLHVFGERPKKIYAQGFKVRTSQWDHVNCYIILESGRAASITVGRNHVFEKRSLELINQKGCLYIDLCQHEILTAPSLGSNQREKYEHQDHLLVEQQSFYRCIQNGQSPIVSIEEGIEVLFYLEKILLALESKQVIEL